MKQFKEKSAIAIGVLRWFQKLNLLFIVRKLDFIYLL